MPTFPPRKINNGRSSVCSQTAHFPTSSGIELKKSCNDTPGFLGYRTTAVSWHTVQPEKNDSSNVALIPPFGDGYFSFLHSLPSQPTLYSRAASSNVLLDTNRLRSVSPLFSPIPCRWCIRWYISRYSTVTGCAFTFVMMNPASYPSHLSPSLPPTHRR